MQKIHRPKFGKKCFNCTNRFICWTNKETTDPRGAPRCGKCDAELILVGEVENAKLMDKLVLVGEFRCPHKKWNNFHDKGEYMMIKHRWIKRFL